MIIANLSHMETIAQENGIQGQGNWCKPKHYKPETESPSGGKKYPKYEAPSTAVAFVFAFAATTGPKAKAEATGTAKAYS